MKEDRLKELLAKYYEGNTNLQEEDELRKLLTGDYVSTGFEFEKEIFSQLDQITPHAEMDDDLPGKIIRSIDQSATEPSYIRPVNILRIVAGIAAVLVILTGMVYFFINSQNRAKDTYNDPQIAYIEAMKVLKGVSDKLNIATTSIQPIGKLYTSTDNSLKSVDKVTGKLTSSMEKLNVISRLNNEN